MSRKWAVAVMIFVFVPGLSQAQSGADRYHGCVSFSVSCPGADNRYRSSELRSLRFRKSESLLMISRLLMTGGKRSCQS